MLGFILFFAFDALVVLVSGFFFVAELADDPVASMTVYLPIMVIGTAGLVAASLLREKHKNRLAILVLSIPALPTACLVLFYGLVSATGGFHH